MYTFNLLYFTLFFLTIQYNIYSIYPFNKNYWQKNGKDIYTSYFTTAFDAFGSATKVLPVFIQTREKSQPKRLLFSTGYNTADRSLHGSADERQVPARQKQLTPLRSSNGRKPQCGVRFYVRVVCTVCPCLMARVRVRHNAAL